jgi:hypothetical protein
MINELLGSLRCYARERREEVRRGACSAKFALLLFQCYSESMMNALSILGRDTDVRTIQHEAKQLCSLIYKG